MSPIRPIAFLVAASAVIGLGIDAGSVALTRLTVPNHVRDAGYAAAEAVEGEAVNQGTAQLALTAAAEDARSHGMKIRAKSFTIYKDGRVVLTGSQTAPTLLLDRIAPLRHFTKVKATETVTALPYS